MRPRERGGFFRLVLLLSLSFCSLATALAAGRTTALYPPVERTRTLPHPKQRERDGIPPSLDLSHLTAHTAVLCTTSSL